MTHFSHSKQRYTQLMALARELPDVKPPRETLLERIYRNYYVKAQPATRPDRIVLRGTLVAQQTAETVAQDCAQLGWQPSGAPNIWAGPEGAARVAGNEIVFILRA